MKVGIYITGLAQSFVNESIEKYAERLKNEMSYYSNGIDYELFKEDVKYSDDKTCKKVSICEKDNPSKVFYRMYEFQYREILTERFNKFSIIRKSYWLFLLLLKKIPLAILRLFTSKAYDRPLETLYLFIIFLFIAGAILFMIPAVLGSIGGDETIRVLYNFKNIFYTGDIKMISAECLSVISKYSISLTGLILILVPNANVLVTNLATEFVCANDYLDHGAQKQLIQGNLEQLVDYITECEPDSKIHFHTYSFGSILALDYLYPFGNTVSRNTERFCEAIITIGSPYQFVSAYYPDYYANRKTELGDKVHWLNIYSIADALATNFRNDSKIGKAQFGINKISNKPQNLNYEVVTYSKFSIIDFFMLNSLKVHGMYWDQNSNGQSCLRLIFKEMLAKNLISTE